MCTQTPVFTEKSVYLTFDDAPGEADANNTLQVLAILHSKGIKATFFITGIGSELMGDTWKSVVSQIYAEGHTLGNHSYNHTTFSTLPLGDAQTPDTVIWQVEHTQQLIEGAVGHPLQPRYFRFPYLDEKWRPEIESLGYIIEGIDIDSQDWGPRRDPERWEALADSVVGQIENSALDAPIVLFHSPQAVTVKALPKIIDDLGDVHYMRFPQSA